MKKEYFHSVTEFPCGSGEIFTEFIDGVATRQINCPANGVARASSSIQDWSADIGFLLFDGVRGDLEISLKDEIKQEDFERAWNAVIGNQ
ncbi:hypothetical protein [Burkholderia sp. D-99]|uniref:hypothetical protein n=1 Tax=Burkholderia sp. D-99 TaxID=2717316 RepID=UPI00141E9D84|nr:hypothetical protein [Burkholderia sp. D-99]NHV29592.1 hypothetical protein [Burkholderia sp. D-99]